MSQCNLSQQCWARWTLGEGINIGINERQKSINLDKGMQKCAGNGGSQNICDYMDSAEMSYVIWLWQHLKWKWTLILDRFANKQQSRKMSLKKLAAALKLWTPIKKNKFWNVDWNTLKDGIVFYVFCLGQVFPPIASDHGAPHEKRNNNNVIWAQTETNVWAKLYIRVELLIYAGEENESGVGGKNTGMKKENQHEMVEKPVTMATLL